MCATVKPTLTFGSFARVTGVLLAAGAAFGETTGSAGNELPFDNRQPSVVINFAVTKQGIFGLGVPVRMFAFNLPEDWTPADGRLLSRNQYSMMYDQIGTTYGGDGVATFAVPDLRGRSPIGAGEAPGGSVYAAGQVDGSSHVTLSLAQMPAHGHSLECGAETGLTGGGQPFDNRQPTQALHWELAKAGVFPFRPFAETERGGGASPALPFFGQIVLHSVPATLGGLYTPANGGVMFISLNSALFSILGTYYGGNGTQQFGIPELRGRLVNGVGEGTGGTSYVVGETGGTEFVTLDSGQIPEHVHTVPGGPPSGAAGTGEAADNRQPLLSVQYCIAVNGVYPAGSEMDDTETYVGEIIAFAGNFAPAGFLPCDGRLMAVAENETLAALLGPTYGGDGVTTFALPDLRGRVPLGVGPGLALGTYLGEDAVPLTGSNLPAHTHELGASCEGDYDGNGERNTTDLVLFLSRFGQTTTPGYCGDLTGDGFVNTGDLVLFLSRFGVACD